MRSGNLFATFLVDYLYYIPQFLPVAKEMKYRGLNFVFVLPDRNSKDITATIEPAIKTLEKYQFDYIIKDDKLTEKISTYYLVCGGNSYPETNIKFQKSVLIVHGVGTKKGYFTEEKNLYDIRFVEGEYRYNRLQELYPDYPGLAVNVGFAKLDDVVNMSNEMKSAVLKRMNLDSKKKTILYAPTFFPSSIEKMSSAFPDDFREYNIIIKPHFFTYLRKRYNKQRKKLNEWRQYDNVYVANVNDYNIVPFLAVADIMISDESSVIFEFAALNKPVICNRFLKLRLSYRLFGKRKFNKRMDDEMKRFRDIGANVFSYRELKACVKMELHNPERLEKKRKEYTRMLIGNTDGNVSRRIVDILERN